MLCKKNRREKVKHVFHVEKDQICIKRGNLNVKGKLVDWNLCSLFNWILLIMTNQ